MRRDLRAKEREREAGIHSQGAYPGASPHRTWGFAARGCHEA
jgi:hypothetical protein